METGNVQPRVWLLSICRKFIWYKFNFMLPSANSPFLGHYLGIHPIQNHHAWTRVWTVWMSWIDLDILLYWPTVCKLGGDLLAYLQASQCNQSSMNSSEKSKSRPDAHRRPFARAEDGRDLDWNLSHRETEEKITYTVVCLVLFNWKLYRSRFLLLFSHIK